MCTHQTRPLPQHIVPERTGSRPTPARSSQDYRPPRLESLGSLKALIRGATSKGVDATGGVDLDMPYPC